MYRRKYFYADCIQENEELRHRLMLMNQTLQEKDKTIETLQHQMVRIFTYSCSILYIQNYSSDLP